MTATVPRVSLFNIICLENSLCSYPGLSSGDLVVISGYSISKYAGWVRGPNLCFSTPIAAYN